MKLQDWTTNILQLYGAIATNKHEPNNGETKEAGKEVTNIPKIDGEIQNQENNVVVEMKMSTREVEVVEATQV